ncbi:MAG: phenylalanine--tRNA ligase subunit beta [Chloroflexi bacterium]|nr:MAG: phenylalanine--tRNA ligase subunit beta [Chloroflexota bacterium]MBL1196980.1 phenylalanine--tRNA ligase subunit beta [Chloroflexota bacterium]NOH14275.1 phenylalanine--tRNA ligase subunit beta [Chloroflexota bacterium]
MKAPISWLKDFVDIDDIPLEELVYTITMAGLEVEEIHFVGLEPPPGDKHDFKVTGIAWDKELIVVGEILEVMAHPDADRLVLCKLNDSKEEHTVLTGAPNLFEFKGKGPLETSLKVAYAKEGAQLYDGHKEGLQLMTLKRTKIRGVESYSMVCSEKELGLSEEHEGIMLLPEDAPVGTPLADYMGDAVLDIAITPNIARNANIYGIAREISALFKRELKQPDYDFVAKGDAIEGQISIEIREPELNQRFVLALIKDIEIKPSPDWVQRRLNLIGQRPINNVVDVTNYVMFEVGQPLHAFDYDVLVKRAGGKTPVLHTRTAEPGEKLTTLDGEEHELKDFTVLIGDAAGSHSLAGIMGGAETEVSDSTTNVLLEGAHWNYINVRKSLGYLHMHSEASYRFARNMHPEMAPRGVKRGIKLMHAWAGGTIAKGLIDNYPLPVEDPVVEVTPADVTRWLGIELSLEKIAEILGRLEFETTLESDKVLAKMPDHRRDIDQDPIIGKADVMEEIARIYGYDNIPETRMSDVLPPQRGNPELFFEERLRDILSNVGLQEIMTYHMTSPEREARRLPPGAEADDKPYIEIVNPIAADRYMMRKSLLSSVLEILERNSRIRERVAVFEIGHIYMGSEDSPLPDELSRLVIAMTGQREAADWLDAAEGQFDFYDLKGVTDELIAGIHLEGIKYEPYQHPSFHPGKCARIMVGERQVAVLGELHPAVHAQHDLGEAPVVAAEFDLEALEELAPMRHDTEAVPNYPPVLEDLAIVVGEAIPAAQIEALITQTGKGSISAVQLFDVYRGEQIGAGNKSLAYNLTYQAPDRTMTDKEVAKIRKKIVARLDRELQAKLRE